MLKKYEIIDETAAKGSGVIIPGVGMVPLDSELLTDEMVEEAIKGGSSFFKEVKGKIETKTLTIDEKGTK